jgi:hypothetical protein
MRQLVVVAGALFAVGMVIFAPTAALAADPTTTAVVSSANPSVFGQSVTFTATVTDIPNGATIPTGSVDFIINGSFAGTVSLNGSGQATFTPSTLAFGNYSISADYHTNSATFLDSSGSLGGGQTVVPASTTTIVVSSANPSVFGQSVTFTATVPASAPSAAFPSGSVSFSIDGGAPITVPLANNGGPVLTAPLTTSSLSIGSHSISATYNADLGFLGSSGSLSGGQVVNAGQPSVTSISPNNGPPAGGTSATITGTNLTGATAVKFGSINATSFTVNSATSITATAPAGAGTVDVTVTTAGGTSPASPADQFTYVLPVPTVTSVSPNTGPTTGGTAVTISGTNFTGATSVKFGSINATSFTVNSATSITATAPAGAGTVDVTVTTAGGTSPASPADQFTYNLPMPSIISVSPNTGPTTGGTAVTISGTTFTGATSVKFGSINATSFTVNSATSITATAPAGGGTVDVTVTTAGGTSPASPADQFTYVLPVPTVTSVSPDTGPTTGGTAVTISGANFSGATSVKFGSSNATSFTAISATQLSAIAPPGSLGTVDVTIKTPGGTSAISPADQYSYAVPADSVNLRKLQAIVTPMAAQVWGQATVGAMQSAVSEGFAGGGGQLISPSGNGVRFNFSADPDDQQQQATDATARARNRFGSAGPFSSAYGSFDTNARGMAGPGGSRVNGGASSRTDEAFAALGYAGPVKAQPLRATEPRQWLGWAEVSGATLSRWSAPAVLGAAAATPTVYGDQVNVTAGVTRMLTPNFLVGVLGGWETFDYRSDAIQGRLTGTGWTAGAYAGWKLSSTVRFDAGFAYSGIGFDGTAGTASGSFAGNRLLVSGGLTGNYESHGFKIEPSARVYALWEHENAYTDTLGTAQAGRDFSTGRASTGVKLAYPFAWTSTVMLSPYAGIYGDYYFNTDNIVVAGAGALPVIPVFAGLSARTEVGMSALFAGGGQFTVGGERSGLGGSFSLWTYRAHASIPFGAQ